MSKTTTQRIDTLQEKIQQLENERKRLMNVQKETERKARTKRLIERGAILESLIADATTFTNEQIKTFLEKTVASDYAKKILDGIIKQGGEPATTKTAQAAKPNGASASDKVAVSTQGEG